MYFKIFHQNSNLPATPKTSNFSPIFSVTFFLIKKRGGKNGHFLDCYINTTKQN